MLAAQPEIRWESWDIKAIVIEGQASTGRAAISCISRARRLNCCRQEQLRGLGTYATSDQLQEQYGADSTVISIGQAGEYLMRGARHLRSPAKRDQRSNHAARGGLGAVMGSKGLKAIVIDKPVGKASPLCRCGALPQRSPHFCPETDQRSQSWAHKGSQHLYGTASIVGAVNEMGSLPTRNFSSGSFERRHELARRAHARGDSGTRRQNRHPLHARLRDCLPQPVCG